MSNWRFAIFLGSASLLLGCSDDETTAPPQGGSAATLTITSPDEGATVAAEVEINGDDVEVATEVEFTVTNFTLREPGTCAGMAACGHVFVKVDGDACNDTEADGEKEPFNERIFASPGDADLLYCPGVTFSAADGVLGANGTHTITLELHNDDGSPVNDATGKIVGDEVKVKVEVEEEGSGGAGGTGGAGGAGGGGGAGGAGGGAGGAGGGPGGAGGAGGS